MPYKVFREIRRDVVNAVAQYCLDIMQAKMLSEMYTITKNEVKEKANESKD